LTPELLRAMEDLEFSWLSSWDCGFFGELDDLEESQKTYWCVLRREWMGMNGIIIDSYCGSFLKIPY